MIIGLVDDVQRHGTSRVKFAYFHCFSHIKNILNQPSNGQEYAQKALVIADQEQNAEMSLHQGQLTSVKISLYRKLATLHLLA